MDTIIAIIIGLDLAIIAGLILVRWSYVRSAKEVRMMTDYHQKQTANAMLALDTAFTNYQLRTDRDIAEIKKEIEIKIKHFEYINKRNRENLPNDIRKTIGHIEFATPLEK